MFDADLWPLKRPTSRPEGQSILKPLEEPLYQEPQHTSLEVSLTKPMVSTGFKKGLPEKIVHMPIVVPKAAKAVYVPSDPFRRSQLGNDALIGLAGQVGGASRKPPAGFDSKGLGETRWTDPATDEELAAEQSDAEEQQEADPTADATQAAGAASEEATNEQGDASASLDATAPEASDHQDAVDAQSVATDVQASSSEGSADLSSDDAEASAEAYDDLHSFSQDHPELTGADPSAGATPLATDAAAAFEQGRQAALEEAAAAAAAEREAAIAEAYARGRAEAQAELQADMAAATESTKQALSELTVQLTDAARDTDAFFAPLKRLAMHLAEQMVRGELSLSGKAVSRLIERSLAEFSQDPSQPVVVLLNPEDLSRFQALGAQMPKGMEVRSDERLQSGSLRVSMNGAVIEDLIEHRRQQLWQALMQDDQPAPPSSFLQNVEQVKEAFEDVFEDLDHDQQ